jgi:hypothetical protein
MASPAVGRSRTSRPGETPSATYACRRFVGASADAGSIPAASIRLAKSALAFGEGMTISLGASRREPRPPCRARRPIDGHRAPCVTVSSRTHDSRPDPGFRTHDSRPDPGFGRLYGVTVRMVLALKNRASTSCADHTPKLPGGNVTVTDAVPPGGTTAPVRCPPIEKL